jgi:glycosyltransferase involved in cell wall biosynthesis
MNLKKNDSSTDLDVSVVIAARNETLHVEEAMRSVLEQKGLTFELIFIDDCSTDDTLSIARKVAGEYSNATVEPNPGRGKVVAFNHGVSIARGHWVCLFSGDDIMPAGSLAARLALVQAAPAGRPVIGLCRLVTMSAHKSQDGHEVPRDPNKGIFTGSTYMLDRQASALLFPVPEKYPNEDTWMEVGAQHLDVLLVHSPVVGCQWRVHDGNSINMLGPFEDFNPKYSARMAAAEQFLRERGDELSPESRRRLAARVRCETARSTGSVSGILTSGAGPIAQARALALSSPFFYEIRKRLYGLLSGW